MNLVVLLNVALSIVACAALAASMFLAFRLGRGDQDDEWPTHVPVAPQPWPSIGPRGDGGWYEAFDFDTIDLVANSVVSEPCWGFRDQIADDHHGGAQQLGREAGGQTDRPGAGDADRGAPFHAHV